MPNEIVIQNFLHGLNNSIVVREKLIDSYNKMLFEAAPFLPNQV